MTCKDCLQNCGEIISDQCVQYTGPTLGDPFDVCQGDQLSVYEANIVAAIDSLLTGTSALPSTISVATCTWFQQQFGTLSPNLNNLLQTLINGECSLYAQIVALTAQVSNFQNGGVIDTSCLTGLSVAPTIPEIVQAIITLLCNINTTVTAFPSTYVRNSDLTSLVTTIVNSIVGGGTTTQFNTRMVPFTAVPYFGPLSNFDSNGIGLSSLGFTRVFVCNGLNGTPDLRGRVPVGAIRNVPGGALDPAVDPSVNPNNPNWALNDKAGETFHTLTTAELGAHTHGITDPGHTHSVSIPLVSKPNGARGPPVVSSVTVNQGFGSLNTNGSTTGISINQAGGNQPHNNIQPSIASYYIMYIP